MLCQWGGEQRKLGGSIAGTGDLNWPKGHSTPQNIMPSIWTGGSYPEGEPVWAWEEGSGMGQWVVSNCMVHCLFFPFHYYHSLSFTVVVVVFYFIFNYSTLLVSNCKFYFDSPPRSTTVEGWGGGWVSGCVVLNFQLGLNHNTDELLVCLCSNPQVRAAKEKDHEKQTPLKKIFSFLLSD